jgi:dihydroorotase
MIVFGGRVVDPTQKLDRIMDVIVENGRIAALRAPGKTHKKIPAKEHSIDAQGMWIFPGLIDLHVHLREPGFLKAETVATGTRAAAAGGVTPVVCMPNTNPVLDGGKVLSRLVESIRRRAVVRVLPAAALSVGLLGKKVTDVDALVKSGAAVFSDDGIGTERENLLAKVLRKAQDLGLTILAHCEDRRVSQEGVMNAGLIARRLGLPGYPVEAESESIRRHLVTLKKTGGRLHIQHVSTKKSLDLIRGAKAAGLPVSCEVTPHHLFLTERDVELSFGQNANLKMNPPLRSSADVEALRKGLSDGTVDAVATDHAPHLASAKKKGFLKAPFGVVGLETALPLMLRLVRERVLLLKRAVELLTMGPAGILGVEAGSLKVGRPADMVILDPRETWTVISGLLHSRSKNSAFEGWKMQGRVVWTLVGGKPVWSRRR